MADANPTQAEVTQAVASPTPKPTPKKTKKSAPKEDPRGRKVVRFGVTFYIKD